MIISIFPGVDRSTSIDRYTCELAQHFPVGPAIRVVRRERSPGLRGWIDKYYKYLQLARQHDPRGHVVDGDEDVAHARGLRFSLPYSSEKPD